MTNCNQTQLFNFSLIKFSDCQHTVGDLNFLLARDRLNLISYKHEVYVRQRKHQPL